MTKVEYERIRWGETPHAERLYKYAKHRAKKKGRTFTIVLADIVIPATCPVLGIAMDQPSLDRMDSSKGYEPGNVRVISFRANVLKNNATVEELRNVLNYVEHSSASLSE